MEIFFSELSEGLYSIFFDSRKRLFIGYLACSLLVALLWLCIIKKNSIKSAICSCLDKKSWLSKSSKSDYWILLINKAIFILLSPALVTQVTIATLLFNGLNSIVEQPLLFIDKWQVSLLFTIFLFLLDDFTRFYMHRIMHIYPALWSFHKMHHSARTMTPLTVLRTHPIEGVLFSLRSSVVQGISIALFVFIFSYQVDFVSVLGANVFIFIFNIAGSNLRHSNINIYYWSWLEKWLISPSQHQIHHSTAPKHFDKNFGVTLAVWDRIFGSLHHSEPNTKLNFGLTRVESPKEQSLIRLYFLPFKEVYKLVFRDSYQKANKKYKVKQTGIFYKL